MVLETKSTEDEFNLPPINSEPAAASLHTESLGVESSNELTTSKATEVKATPSLPGVPIIGTGFPPTHDPAAVPISGAITSSTNTQSADNGDLIEKEWVEKAKQIVEKTKGDPYTQSNEINHVKVDYLKKRYNKDVEVSG